MSETLRNSLVAFALAATAVIVLSLVVLLASNGGDSSTTVGDPAAVTPAVLGESETPILSPTPTP